MKSCWFFGLIFMLSLASASNYSAEFRQIGDSISFKEAANNYETVLVDSSLLDKSQTGYYFTKKIVFNESYSFVKVTLVLDKDITPNVNTDYFLLRRYVDDPSNIIIDVDKPSGGTSGGILKPEFVTTQTEKQARDAISSLLQ